jgi:hypothetical protein
MTDEKLVATETAGADDRSYETPTLHVLGTVEELAAANEDSIVPA